MNNTTFLVFMITLLTSCFLLSCKTSQRAAESEYLSDQTSQSKLVETDTFLQQPPSFSAAAKSFDKKIHSAFLASGENIKNIMPLEGGTLTLHFDRFDLAELNYTVHFQHCDYKFNASKLNTSEFQEGEDFLEITQFEPSFNTARDFIHYQYSFPNQDVQFLLSGNYMLFVKHPNTDSIVLQLPFYIVDNKVQVKGRITDATNPRFKFSHQNLNLSVNTGDCIIENPYSNFKVLVSQNNREDTIRELPPPSMVNGREINYSSSDKLHFKAGKEFRYIDLRDIDNPEARIKEIKYIGNHALAILKEEPIRSFKSNISLADFNGKFQISTTQAEQIHSRAEYVKVKVTLGQREQYNYDDIHIIGAFNNWQPSPESKLHYNGINKNYEVNLELKQGYYNFEFVTTAKGTFSPSSRTLTEGHHPDTENDYYVYIYTIEPGQNHYSLVGTHIINSRKTR